jgi:hypothetical protein
MKATTTSPAAAGPAANPHSPRSAGVAGLAQRTSPVARSSARSAPARGTGYPASPTAPTNTASPSTAGCDQLHPGTERSQRSAPPWTSNAKTRSASDEPT